MMADRATGVIELSGSPESVSLAREYVKTTIGADHPAVDDVTLLVSELVTNAVVHSDSHNGGKVTLTVTDGAGRIRGEVRDAGGDTVPRPCNDMLAEGGRGLLLVDLISTRWGVEDDIAGRVVWFELTYDVM
ncbi:ATP-binding protein [Sphaerisporangium sp. B11E5]|uniref:ATP-binding protein n=1 Tax=Sphaerisporangium sp. B11E5 TaxID=3153563 RepID=UPI00325E4026